MKIKYLAILAGIAGLAFAIYLAFPSHLNFRPNPLGIKLDQPDALIRSSALSRLPRDLMQVPVAKAVLTEELADYYESHEDRLAVAGTVRRMAFEHDLSLPDKLIESVFDEEAEVAFWRGGDGSLRYFALAMTRNRLARFIETVAHLIPGDQQLHRVGDLAGHFVPLYVLEFGYHRQFLIASQGDRVVVLSHPGMLFRDKGAFQDASSAEVIARLLEPDNGSPTVFDDAFGLGPRPHGPHHEVVVSARYLSFGYQAFAPGVQALAFSFDGQGQWQTRLRLAKADDRKLLDAQAMWRAAPHGASLCSVIPADWSGLAALTAPLGQDKEAIAALSTRFEGPAGVCWYPSSRLYTPLFVARLKAPADAAALKQFKAVFAAAVGVGEPGSAQSTERDGATLMQEFVNSRHGVKAPVDEALSDDTPTIEAATEQDGSSHADHAPASGDPDARGFAVSLGVSGQTIAFSPDQQLVTQTLDVARHRYPSIADGLAEPQRTLALLDPSALARLFTQEAFAALPRDEEPILRNAADAHLVPRLEALAMFPRWWLELDQSDAHDGWSPVSWHAPRQ